MPTDTNATELRDILQVGQIDVGNETLFSKRDKLRVSTDHLNASPDICAMEKITILRNIQNVQKVK